MKKQSRKIGVAGGFINQLMGNNSSEPIVGEGATILHYSDRSAYQVIEVSNDGLTCVLQKMDCKFIGSGYGDERYEYADNPEGQKITLEWNAKKSCWGGVSYTVEVIKSLAKKYYKQYGFGWFDKLLKENNLTFDELVDGENLGVNTKYKLIDGLTKRYKNFNEVSVIFGIAEQYRDPHF